MIEAPPSDVCKLFFVKYAHLPLNQNCSLMNICLASLAVGCQLVQDGCAHLKLEGVVRKAFSLQVKSIDSSVVKINQGVVLCMLSYWLNPKTFKRISTPIWRDLGKKWRSFLLSDFKDCLLNFDFSLRSLNRSVLEKSPREVCFGKYNGFMLVIPITIIYHKK